MTPFAFHVKTVALKIVCHSLKVIELIGEGGSGLPCAGSHDRLPHSPTHTWSSAGNRQHVARSLRTCSLHALSDFPRLSLGHWPNGSHEKTGIPAFYMLLILSSTLFPNQSLATTARKKERRKSVQNSRT